jgi:hypothetical protein
MYITNINTTTTTTTTTTTISIHWWDKVYKERNKEKKLNKYIYLTTILYYIILNT